MSHFIAYARFDVISLRQSSAGELVFHVFGAIAHFERRLIVERTREGIVAALKRGKTPGRPRLNDETVSAAQKLIAAGLIPDRRPNSLELADQRLIGLFRMQAEAQLTPLE